MPKDDTAWWLIRFYAKYITQLVLRGGGDDDDDDVTFTVVSVKVMEKLISKRLSLLDIGYQP